MIVAVHTVFYLIHVTCTTCISLGFALSVYMYKFNKLKVKRLKMRARCSLWRLKNPNRASIDTLPGTGQ